jgi:hypothetical protein
MPYGRLPDCEKGCNQIWKAGSGCNQNMSGAGLESAKNWWFRAAMD